MSWALPLGVFLLVANGFFVAAEFALIGARRTSIDQLAAAGDRRARLAQRLQAQLSVQLAGAQLGITLASLALGKVSEPAVARVIEDALEGVVDLPDGALHAVAFAVALSLVVVLHMLVGEMVPKSVAITYADTMLRWVALPMWLFTLAFRPLLWALNVTANGVLRLVGVEPRDELANAATAEELRAMFSASRAGGLLEDDVHALLERGLGYDSLTAADVARPLASVSTVATSATRGELARAVVDDHATRVVVLDADGQVLGFVHANDVLAWDEASWTRPVPVSAVRRMVRVEGATRLTDVLLAMRRTSQHMALVGEEDEPGVVTLDDVLGPLISPSPI